MVNKSAHNFHHETIVIKRLMSSGPINRNFYDLINKQIERERRKERMTPTKSIFYLLSIWIPSNGKLSSMLRYIYQQQKKKLIRLPFRDEEGEIQQMKRNKHKIFLSPRGNKKRWKNKDFYDHRSFCSFFVGVARLKVSSFH